MLGHNRVICEGTLSGKIFADRLVGTGHFPIIARCTAEPRQELMWCREDMVLNASENQNSSAVNNMSQHTFKPVRKFHFHLHRFYQSTFINWHTQSLPAPSPQTRDQ